MLLDKLKTNDGKPIFNKKVSFFFIKLFVLFSLWFVCYIALLYPGRVIDRPLTNFLTASVTKSINFLSSEQIDWIADPVRPCTHLTKKGVAVFDIYDVCNGIDLMFIYVGVLFLLPYPLKRKIVFSIGGIIAIITLNIIRITSLYFIYLYHRSAFDFSHHYLFTLLMYVLIFYGWLLFVKKSKAHG
ncbi:MAG: archaeosortase/exosortase family protein [Bacteroidota bacterium]